MSKKFRDLEFGDRFLVLDKLNDGKFSQDTFMKITDVGSLFRADLTGYLFCVNLACGHLIILDGDAKVKRVETGVEL